MAGDVEGQAPHSDKQSTPAIVYSMNTAYTSLKHVLEGAIKGDVKDDENARREASRDASLFERMPELVVYPKDAEDVSTIVREVSRAKEAGMHVELAARAAGTCMSGGSLTTGVVISFTEHMNHVGDVNVGPTTSHIGDGWIDTEPGVFYRDFEKTTLKQGLIFPSYPASRELCAMGGIVGNNAGGERTLAYGKTSRYVEEVDVVLADGSLVHFKPLTPAEVEEKKKLNTLEGTIYREIDAILTEDAELIEAHRPKVSKNSAGYALWDVRDPKTGTTNLTRLFTGSQGTLAIFTKARIALIKPKPHRAMLVVFLQDLTPLPEIVSRVLQENPESFESYDDKTFKLAVKFLPALLKQLGIVKAAHLGYRFIPEALQVVTGGVPKLLLMAEFADDTAEGALSRARAAQASLTGLGLRTRIEKNEHGAEKYWIVRRESFALLRSHVKGLRTAPFIDDFVVPPEQYGDFLPKLDALIAKYSSHFIYTIAGHVGNGNFHIIPLMDLSKPENRQIILELAPQVYDLVIKAGGTTTGEHNDGIIRTPYLTQLFGSEMIALFERVKRAFDPQNILNPGKKVNGTLDDIKRDMITTRV